MKITLQKGTPHVVIRLGSLSMGGVSINVIEEHNTILKSAGTVFFGKAGRTFHNAKFDLLKAAIKDSKQILFIILTKQSKNELRAYSAILYDIYGSEYAPNLNFIPKYYHDSITNINTWFQIGHLEQMSNSRLNKFTLISNGKPLIQTVVVCRTALMLVSEGS